MQDCVNEGLELCAKVVRHELHFFNLIKDTDHGDTVGGLDLVIVRHRDQKLSRAFVDLGMSLCMALPLVKTPTLLVLCFVGGLHEAPVVGNAIFSIVVCRGEKLRGIVVGLGCTVWSTVIHQIWCHRLHCLELYECGCAL